MESSNYDKVISEYKTRFTELDKESAVCDKVQGSLRKV